MPEPNKPETKNDVVDNDLQNQMLNPKGSEPVKDGQDNVKYDELTKEIEVLKQKNEELAKNQQSLTDTRLAETIRELQEVTKPQESAVDYEGMSQAELVKAAVAQATKEISKQFTDQKAESAKSVEQMQKGLETKQQSERAYKTQTAELFEDIPNASTYEKRIEKVEIENPVLAHYIGADGVYGLLVLQDVRKTLKAQGKSNVAQNGTAPVSENVDGSLTVNLPETDEGKIVVSAIERVNKKYGVK